MSSISNYIQLLLNGLAVSLVILSTVYKSKDFNEILTRFNSIDVHLVTLDCRISYKNDVRKFVLAISVFASIFLGKTIFESFVYIEKYALVSVVYWIIPTISVAIYLMCLHLAILLIYFLLVRCEMVNNLLKSNMSEKRSASQVIIIVMPATAQGGREKLLKVVHQLTDEIFELCDRINGFFGLSLLVSLIAMFAITAIQSFYCYTISKDIAEDKARSTWTLFASINMVVLNLVFVGILAYVSDRMSFEADFINTNTRKLQDELGIKERSCLHSIVRNIRVSAFGFFNINCNMLCGYLSALITYILILVQCNEIAGDKTLPSAPITSKPKPCPFDK